jgi:hypothetical protein
VIPNYINYFRHNFGDHTETECEEIGWIQVAQDRELWGAIEDIQWIFGFHNSSLSGRLLATQKRLCFIYLFIYLFCEHGF